MTGAFVLITLGVLFLLNNLYPSDFRFGRLWPVILIVIGVVKIVEYFQSPGTVGSEGPPPRRPVPPPVRPAPPAPSAPRAPVAPRAMRDALPAANLDAPTRHSAGYQGDDIPAPEQTGGAKDEGI